MGIVMVERLRSLMGFVEVEDGILGVQIIGGFVKNCCIVVDVTHSENFKSIFVDLQFFFFLY